MQLSGEAKLLRIFIGESDKSGSITVYEKIVIEARKSGLAGATVIKGIMGFGGTSIIHTSKILRLSEDLPLIIEIVDEEKKIEKFIPILDQILSDGESGGLVTIERAEILKYISKSKK